MLAKTVEYTDYRGTKRNETHYFNISQAELAKLELSTVGGLSEELKRVVEAKDAPAIINFVEKIILMSYGVKSPDGRKFEKFDREGYRLADDFKQTEAYSILFMELVTSAEKAAAFVNGILPELPPVNVTEANESIALEA